MLHTGAVGKWAGEIDCSAASITDDTVNLQVIAVGEPPLVIFKLAPERLKVQYRVEE